ncbi:DMT family transporter [Rhodobacteraceae bacterium NNCM2]|nr:DMT family transporter [Coraliihabitans acroporae]
MTPTIRAVFWMIGAILSFSLMAVSGREASSELDTFEVMLFRSLIGFVFVVAFGAATGRLGKTATQRHGLHLVRNICHFTGQNLWFYAITLIPLAHVFSLEFTTPIWVALFAPLVVGEALTKGRIIAALIGFAGILIIVRPGFIPVDYGHGVALLCSIFFAATVLTTKRLSRTDSVWTILFWMTLMQAVMGAVFAGYDGDISLPTGVNLLWTLLIGICGLTAHLSITKALSLAPASVVAPIDFLRLPLIAVVGMLLYGEPLELAVFVGAALILAGNLYNLRQEARR